MQADEAAAKAKEEEEKKRAAAALKRKEEEERKAAAAKLAAQKKKDAQEALRLEAAAKEAEQRRVAALIADGSMSVTQTADGRLIASGGTGDEEIHLEQDHLAAVNRVAKDVTVTVQPAPKKKAKAKSKAQGGSPKAPSAEPTAAPQTFKLKSVTTAVSTPLKKRAQSGTSSGAASEESAAPATNQGVQWKKKTQSAAEKGPPLPTIEVIQTNRKGGLGNLSKRLKDNNLKHSAVLDIIGTLINLISTKGPNAIETELATGKQAQVLLDSIKPMVLMLKESPGNIIVLIALGLLRFGGKASRVVQDLNGIIPEAFSAYSGAVLATRAFFEIGLENKKPPILDEDGEPIEFEEPEELDPKDLNPNDPSVIVVLRAQRAMAAQAQLKHLKAAFAASKTVKLSADHNERSMARMRTLGNALDLALRAQEESADKSAATLSSSLQTFEHSEEAVDAIAADNEVERLKSQLAELMTERNELDAEAAQMKEKAFRSDGRLPSVQAELENTTKQKDEIIKWLADVEDDAAIGRWLQADAAEENAEPENVSGTTAAETEVEGKEDKEEEEEVAPKSGFFGSKKAAKAKRASQTETIAEKEAAKKLQAVKTRIGSEAHITNEGANVDPTRDIGHIGSQYQAEEIVPEWMKKRRSKQSF